MAGSNTVKGVLSELAKRVPKNQLSQLRNFLELHAKYNDRVNKYPAKLPTIDWDYYRTNVRIEAIKMVDEFEKKYEELNKIFDDRVKLDTTKYFDELEKQRAAMQAEVNQYIAESNERIKAYEAEMERLSLMKPYSSMTMEEYISLRPEHADYIPHRRKPLFWPHDPDEQIPGPVGIKKPDDDDGSHPVKPSDFKGKTEEFVFNAGDAKAQKPMVIADSAEPQPIQTQPVEVKATKAPQESKLSQPCAESKKPMVVECESKDANKDVPSKVSEGKRGDTCARTPYYNPFRSEEENIKQEEEACDECKEEDPCKSDKRSPKTPYYNPFKDKKE
ncbi:uncharacterized protein LOC118743975 [Rhagoletis pomonella]|uniref:uncharacterized protein LOC118743975 n=1 Tax=Rhagoletis pomonella TaxID=28610 RepID=UPI001783797A|nr:uncharacterized protein LOC118743975 [Rhagoletis pomonella]